MRRPRGAAGLPGPALTRAAALRATPEIRSCPRQSFIQPLYGLRPPPKKEVSLIPPLRGFPAWGPGPPTRARASPNAPLRTGPTSRSRNTALIFMARLAARALARPRTEYRPGHAVTCAYGLMRLVMARLATPEPPHSLTPANIAPGVPGTLFAGPPFARRKAKPLIFMAKPIRTAAAPPRTRLRRGGAPAKQFSRAAIRNRQEAR